MKKMELYKMIYKIGENTSFIRIFGKDFIGKNKNKYKLIIKNKKESLKDIINIKDFYIKKILMISTGPINNKRNMFKDCELLESFNQLSIDDYSELFERKSNDFQNGLNNAFTEKEYQTIIPFIDNPMFNDEQNYFYDYDNDSIFSQILLHNINTNNAIENKISTLDNYKTLFNTNTKNLS